MSNSRDFNRLCVRYKVLWLNYIVSVYMDSGNRALVYFDKFDLHVFGIILNLKQSLAKS